MVSQIFKLKFDQTMFLNYGRNGFIKLTPGLQSLDTFSAEVLRPPLTGFLDAGERINVSDMTSSRGSFEGSF
jgi:hypothetical protein